MSAIERGTESSRTNRTLRQGDAAYHDAHGVWYYGEETLTTLLDLAPFLHLCQSFSATKRYRFRLKKNFPCLPSSANSVSQARASS
jgi:hypothetical protein